MKLVVLTSENSVQNELSVLYQLFDEGLKVLHLRKPNWSLEQTDVFLSQIDTKYHSKIVLHNHYELSEKYDVLGIHKNNRNAKTWKTWNEQTVQKSASVHSLNEIND